MDFRHFRCVQKIADERSFSRAAEKLYMAQPALSQYISNLERELGTKLFDRSKNPISLTYVGELFLEKAKLVLEIENEIHNEIKNINTSGKGRLTIAISPNRGSYLLPKILPAFSQLYPNVEINLLEGVTGKFAELLNKDEVDLAILAGPIKDEKITIIPIQNDYILLALPATHPAMKYVVDRDGDYPILPLKMLKNERFILSKPNQGLRNMADKMFEEEGFSPYVYLETQSFETAHRLAIAGMGVAISSSTLGPTNLRDDLCYVRPAEQAPCRTIVIAYKNKKVVPWIIKQFIAVTKDVMSAYDVSNVK